jgi:hypothetical protein
LINKIIIFYGIALLLGLFHLKSNNYFQMSENENQYDLLNEDKDKKAEMLFLIILMALLIISFNLKKPEKNNIENRILRFFDRSYSHNFHYIFFNSFNNDKVWIN